jgi:transcriptional regulator with XRE-family HTH domain
MWMKLAEYLREQRKPAEVFAGEIGVSKSAVAMWARGARMPRREMLQKITRATNGKVTANDFASAA